MHLKINSKLQQFLTTQKPIKVLIGGRGGGKSIACGDIFTFKMETEGADIYCLREYQDSILDSVHRVFVDSIFDRLKLTGWTVTENRIQSPGGSRTTYRGAARNPDSIQSAQGYKYSWFEEAHRASKKSLDKLLPTILRNPGAECWFTGNPQSSGDPFSQRFIVPYQDQLDRDGYYEDDIHLIQKINWQDNPWWNEEQEALRVWDYEHRPRAEYDWIWEGAFNDHVENALITAEWFDACIDAHIKLGFKPTGARYAAHDPSDQGGDTKGYALRHGSVLVDVREKIEGDVNEGCDWATGLARQANADYFCWDCDGMGAALNRQVATALRDTRCQIRQFKGSESPDNPTRTYEPVADSGIVGAKKNEDVFRNKRAQYYGYLRDRIYRTYRAVQYGDYADPDELLSISSKINCMQKLRAELCRMPTKPNPNGKLQLYTKPEMLAKFSIQSPNLGDSCAMSLLQGAVIQPKITMPKPMGSIGRGRNAR